MATMKATMRTLGGIILRRAEIRMFEKVSTKVTADPHAVGVLDRVGDRQGGAEPEHQAEGGISAQRPLVNSWVMVLAI